MKFLRSILFILYSFVGCIVIFSCSTSERNNETTHFQLNYTLTGNGDKTLVFIHGWCINQAYWADQVNHFKNNYKVLTLDLPGHGQSEDLEQGWTIENYASAVSELIRKLGLNNLILIGHSMSGNIILHVYDEMPQKVYGFIGVDNLQQLGVEYSEEQKQEIFAYFDQMENNFDEISQAYVSQNLFSFATPEPFRKRLLNDISNCDPQMATATLRSLIEQGRREKTLAMRLKIPMQLILSDSGQKPLVDEESLNKYAGAGYHIYTIEGTGHYPMSENPREFNKKLEEALKNL